MRPISLTMGAFGSYKEKTQIDFTRPSQNFFLITGDTGAGKTTIFDAIVFALYGEASSTSTRKDGTELQSQYADQGVEPYVELVFSEREGDTERVYTVRRSPRYLRPLKRKTRDGSVEQKETVSLFLPDGQEFSANQKETDAKLEEIVGLTKNQFMQVAMIAQGEFMELLRASSDTKKVIFRKLFGTDHYQAILDELQDRRKALDTKIAQIRTICRTEAGRVRIPEDYEQAEEVSQNRKKIRDAERFSVTDTEEFLRDLTLLCGWLEEKTGRTKKRSDQALKERDAGREACTHAENLIRLFEQQDQAGKELAECEEETGSIREAAKLAEKIDHAYEIRAAFERFEDAKAAEDRSLRGIKELQDALPELEASVQRAVQAESGTQQEWNEENERFLVISERVRKAMDAFAGIRAREKTIRERQDQHAEAVRKKEEQEEARRKEAEAAEKAYLDAKKAYVRKNEEFMEAQTAFYDQQAGLLARKLKAGIPCPVCGSKEHPHPCRLKEEDQVLTREDIDLLQEELQQLQQEAERWSGKAQEAKRQPENGPLAKTIAGLETQLAADQAALEQMTKGVSYPSEEEADKALNAAKKAKEEKEKTFLTAKNAAEEARKALENARARIAQYTEELPKHQKDRINRRQAYEAQRSETGLTEAEWKEIAARYRKTDAAALRETVTAHEKKKAAAIKMKEAAAELIRGRERPDLALLEQRKKDVEAAYAAAQEEYERCREIRKTDLEALAALTERKEERDAISRKYDVLNSLYMRLAGRVSGARMDLETYVQRYYLSRILRAANLRFAEMSAGQYELRMCDLDRAGEGKNRGLDLMVWSAVTGKEREIRTLSGGESFMAALCLALGLSDQIREQSASVNLDIMFIDEGFGSLDETSRQKAVRILKTMAGGEKLIGIISHVTELKQEIEDQLIVEKDGEGSHVRWQIS